MGFGVGLWSNICVFYAGAWRPGWMFILCCRLSWHLRWSESIGSSTGWGVDLLYCVNGMLYCVNIMCMDVARM